jgi:fluoride exporter
VRLRPSAVLYSWIALGSGIGGIARAWCAHLSAGMFGDAFPWGILLINVLGSLIIGAFFGCAGPGGSLRVRPATAHFITTGLCGGYTTFSAFSLDTLNLIRDGQPLAAGANVALSLALCLLFVWVGYALASRLSRRTSG